MTVVVGLSSAFGGVRSRAPKNSIPLKKAIPWYLSPKHTVSRSMRWLRPMASIRPPSCTPVRTSQFLIGPSSAQVYVVESGDTLASIATERGVSIDAILASNDVADVQNLRVGGGVGDSDRRDVRDRRRQ